MKVRPVAGNPRSRSAESFRWLLVAVAGAVFLAACDTGPSGPGTLLGRASAESLGGVVIEVVGVGIQGFSARGTTQIYASDVPGRSDTHRVILIDPVGGDLGFEIEVDDRGMEGPVISVIQATDTDNATVPVSSVELSLER